MRCTLASLAVLALAAAPALAEVVDTGDAIQIIGDGTKSFNKTLPKLVLPAVKDMKKPLTDDLDHLATRIQTKAEKSYDDNDGKWSKAFMRLMKVTEPLTNEQARLKNKTQDALTAIAAWKEDARLKIQERIDEKQANADKHEAAWINLKSALDNKTDLLKANAKTVKEDMTFLMDKTGDANDKAKSELVDAAFGGKVRLTTIKAEPESEEDTADGGIGALSVSQKFTKPELIEVTGNKTVTFRI